MIVRQFIGWIRTASASERADATRSLARAWLVSELSTEDRAAAEGALLMLLDDPSPLVRRAMADAFAHSDEAPAAIVRALASDQPAVAMPILEFSPLLVDADLVDLVATAPSELQCAVARRRALPPSVSAAIAEVGSAAAALELIENPDAALAPFSWNRIVERHGHLAAVREAMLALPDLPAATRLALADKLSHALTQFVVGRGWLSAARAESAAGEALARSAVAVAGDAAAGQMPGLMRHLRETGQLTAGLILRALLSGHLSMVHHALVELSGLPERRVAALLHGGRSAGLEALLRRAGLPETAYPAFSAALQTMDEIGFVGGEEEATYLRRRMVERVLTRCESTGEADAALLVLLRRFAVESARDEASRYRAELAADDVLSRIESLLAA